MVSFFNKYKPVNTKEPKNTSGFFLLKHNQREANVLIGYILIYHSKIMCDSILLSTLPNVQVCFKSYQNKKKINGVKQHYILHAW